MANARDATARGMTARRLLAVLFLLPLLSLLAVGTVRAQFPEPGRPITVIVPFPPGGGSDTSARALAPLLERELGVPVVVANRAGAASQIGLTQTARARPDGYTLCYGLWPQATTLILDPARQAPFTRDSFATLALHVVDPGTIVVRADSPFHSLADVIAAARTRPDELRVSDNGQLGWEHLASIRIQRAYGVAFNQIHFQGAGPSLAALLGRHTDVAMYAVGTALAQSRQGALRVLAVLDERESPYLPGVPTRAALGTPLVAGSARGFIAPAGLPPEVARRLAEALERTITSREHEARMRELGIPIRYLGPAAFARYWRDEEETLRPLVAELTREGRAN